MIPKFNDFTKKKIVKENEEPQVFTDQKEKESMVLQNLWHISKKAMEIHDDLKAVQGTEIPEWIQEMLASLNDRMNTVVDYLGYQTEVGGELGSTGTVDLDQKEEEDDMEDEEQPTLIGGEPLGMLEAPEESEEETDEELEESKKFKGRKSILLEKFKA